MDFDIDDLLNCLHQVTAQVRQVPEPWRWLIAGLILFVLIVFSDGFRRLLGIIISTALWTATGLPVVWWLRDEFFLPPRHYSFIELALRGCGWVYVPLWILSAASFAISWRQAIQTRKRIEQAMKYDPAAAHGEAAFADDEELRKGGIM